MEDLMREKMAVDAEVARLSAALAEAGAVQAQVTDLRGQARLLISPHVAYMLF